MDFVRSNIKLDNPGAIKTLDISPDGNLLAIGQWVRENDTEKSYLNLLSLPEIEQQPPVEIFRASGEFVESARFTFEGNNLAYITNSKKLVYYHFQSQKNFETPPPSPGLACVIWMSCANNAPRLVTSGLMVSVWDIEKLESIWFYPDYMPFSGKNPAIADLTPDGQIVAIAGTDTDRVLIFDIDRQELIKTLDLAPLQARWAKYAPDLSYFAVLGSATRGIHIWNYESTQKHLPEVFDTAGEGFWCCLCFHPSSKYLAAGTLGGKIYLFRLDNGETVINCKAHQGRVWDLSFTPDGKQLISGGSDGSLSILKLE